jgi:DNA mismatch repair protein MSH3
MPKTPSQSQTKQTSISSFFVPKNTQPKVPASTNLTPSPATNPPVVLLKRPSNGNIAATASKKRRIVSPDDDDENEDPAEEPVKQKVATEASSKLDRAAKYIFSSSPVAIAEDDTPEIRKQKEALHRKFVQKLGRPDSLAEIRRKNNVIEDDEAANAGADDEEQEEPEEEEQPKKKIASKKGGRGKLTPGDTQYLEIKRKHLDKVIVYQVGYKYRFLGEDARIAGKELSIVCIPGKFRYDEHPSEAHLDRFASASIPIPRLHVHVKRLVAAGYKVGVVDQLETAALKAAGDNRNKVFIRELTHVYTQGTYVDEVESAEGLESSLAGYLICLTETNIRSGDDERVRIGMVAVQPTIGSILYDEFDDGFMRGELETRFLHISPCEYILVGELSSATQKLVKHVAHAKRGVGALKARIEIVTKVLPAEAASLVSNFYATKIQESETPEAHVEVLEKIHTLPDLVTMSLATLIKHLEEFGLENVFSLTSNFESFAMRTHMLLNSNTLTSLEIYQSSEDNSEKSSLFWTMDRTKTKFGKRMLRSWVGRPLLDKKHLESRLEAVEEIKERSSLLGALRSLLVQVKGDLEKTLIRIYYNKASRPELLAFLQSIQKIASERLPNSQSKTINDAIATIPKVLDQVVEYLNRIQLQGANADDKYTFFRDEYESEETTDLRLEIAAVEQELEQHKDVAAKEIGLKKVRYQTISGIDYLIEVDNSSHSLSKVPASWIKISNTKKFSRFHTPTVVKLIRQRDQNKEKLANACDVAFTSFLAEISTNYESLRNCIQALATLDCFCSLAEIASQPNYCKPSFNDSNVISISQGRHPMVEQILLDSYVANDIDISAESNATLPSALLITGPNMGGKSSYVRSVALISIMAQIGSYVPATSASLPLLDAVYTRMGALDNLMRGESTFMVELSETSDILRQATSRSLVILDELGRGTSTHDGVAIAEAVLRELVSRNVMTLFITHYQDLAKIQLPGLKNVHVRFEEQGEEITFLYEIGEGVAHRSYG